jgi:NMD protein affecting ribosome stability and mRNA decay
MFVEQKEESVTKTTILCPLCGLKFVPGASNICPACTLASVDSSNILRAGEEQLLCTYCNRYERPPWIHCERESS